MAGRARQGLPIPPPPSAPPRPTKWQSIKLFVSVWKENIMISAAFGLILFSPTIANWWENYRLYKLRRDVREMTSTGDFYSRVPGWVNHEDLLNWNRENDPTILRKVQARNERLGRSASGSEDEQQRGAKHGAHAHKHPERDQARTSSNPDVKIVNL